MGILKTVLFRSSKAVRLGLRRKNKNPLRIREGMLYKALKIFSVYFSLDNGRLWFFRIGWFSKVLISNGFSRIWCLVFFVILDFGLVFFGCLMTQNYHLLESFGDCFDKSREHTVKRGFFIDKEKVGELLIINDLVDLRQLS